METNNKFEQNPNSRVIAGFIIVCVGVALLLRNMGFLLPRWLFSWPVLLIIAGVFTGFKRNFKNHSWIVMIAVGSFFLIQKFVTDIRLEPYFWPLLIIGIGILYIVKPSYKKGDWKNDTKKLSDNWSTSVIKNESYATENISSNDEFVSTSIFSGVKQNILSKNFTSGKVTAVFGGADIDLSKSDFEGTAVIHIDVVFGGLKLIVPPNWLLKNETNGIFHGVEDKRYNNTNALDSNKVLVLKGNCIFGGVEIKSY
jgi:predicted membrane protein